MADEETDLTFGTDAHTASPNENPMDHLGEVTVDPWCDDEQTDWTTRELDLGDDDLADGTSKVK